MLFSSERCEARETIETALMAAETGHLVFSTIHTNSAVDSIDRIVGVFPENKQPQIRLQLSMTLRAVLAQQLVPRATGRGRAAACRAHEDYAAHQKSDPRWQDPQMQSYLLSGAKDGSVIMDHSCWSCQTRESSCRRPRWRQRGPGEMSKSLMCF